MWIVVLSWCASAVLVMSLAFCLCWRRKNTAADWQGLDGMVIQKNPDENVNHLPSVTVSPQENTNAAGEPDAAKRNIITTRRSLPDIPADQNSASNYDPIVDNSSGHYATVGQYQNSTKRGSIANGNAVKPTAPGDTEKPYERVKYDQMKVKEHPYAQLQPTTSRAGIFEESESEENMNLLRVEDVNSNDLAPCSRSRRSSVHSTVEPDNILAAPAVAGVLAASPELPYMTPPVNQANFSGDSQDSSKGYTSISVREPLANIINQTKKSEVNKRKLDPHYSTLSDDSSDDVYTTIADPKNPIYTSESETYARIESLQITVEAEINQSSALQAAEVENVDELYELPPENPVSTVDGPKPSYSHSRQASSSSSVANIGSPKPEKRQANSPLPPPPIVNTFEAHADKSIKNLDDMYAKVHKNKKEEEEPVPFGRTRNRKSLTSVPKVEPTEEEEHNYETLKSRRRISDPAYEKIKGDEPGYASINGSESVTSSDPGYEVLKSKALSEADPNYEELRHKVSNASDFSGYSKIRDLMDGYSVVNKTGRKSTNSSLSCDGDEPNYESMPSDINNVNNNNETDPKYETVEQVLRYRKESFSGSYNEENVWKTELERGQKTGRSSTCSSSSSKKSLPDNRHSSSQNQENNVNNSDVLTDHNLGVVDENGIVQI